MLFVFSHNRHPVFYDDKCMLVHFFQLTLQMSAFVFGQDDNDHIRIFLGITALRFPPGRIPVIFIDNIINDLQRFLFGKYYHFRVDILRMRPVF